MPSNFTDMAPSLIFFCFFLCYRVSLVHFVYWFKFHLNIINGSEVITIFVSRRLMRNSDIRNSPV